MTSCIDVPVLVEGVGVVAAGLGGTALLAHLGWLWICSPHIKGKPRRPGGYP